MISIVAKFNVQVDKKDEFLALAKELVVKSNQEEGCIAYEINQNLEDSSVFAMLEQWKDEAAIDAHNNSDHFKAIVPQLSGLCEVEVDLYKQV